MAPLDATGYASSRSATTGPAPAFRRNTTARTISEKRTSQFPQNATAAHRTDGFRPKEKARLSSSGRLFPKTTNTHRFGGPRMNRFWKSGRVRFAAAGAVALAVAALASVGGVGYAARLVGGSNISAAAAQYPPSKVTICHHTHSQKNP